MRTTSRYLRHRIKCTSSKEKVFLILSTSIKNSFDLKNRYFTSKFCQLYAITSIPTLSACRVFRKVLKNCGPWPHWNTQLLWPAVTENDCAICALIKLHQCTLNPQTAAAAPCIRTPARPILNATGNARNSLFNI